MSRGYLLSLPALVLSSSKIMPLGLTLVLSFNVFDYQVGVKADEWTLAHYWALLSDAYFYEIFWRTFWISALVTLLCVVIGVPWWCHDQPHGHAVALDFSDSDSHAAADFSGGTRVWLEPARRRRPGQSGDPALGGRPMKLLYTPFAVIIGFGT